MQLESPFESLHSALAQACMKDLPDITYQGRNYTFETKPWPLIDKQRRPMPYEVKIIMFPETWGSTALGYGGIGGQAMTPAYTVIVYHGLNYCVYFGTGGLAYQFNTAELTEEQNNTLQAAMNTRHMPSMQNFARLLNK